MIYMVFTTKDESISKIIVKNIDRWMTLINYKKKFYRKTSSRDISFSV